MSTVQNSPPDTFESHGLSWYMIVDGEYCKLWGADEIVAYFSYNRSIGEYEAGEESFASWSEACEFAVRCAKKATCANCKHFEADVDYGALAGLCTRVRSLPLFAVHREFCSNWNLRK